MRNTKHEAISYALAAALLGAMGCAVDEHQDESELGTSEVRFLAQGWDAAQRAEFYQLTQGSRMLPYKWFVELEQATNEKKLRAADNMRRMGFLVDGPSATNPHGLPIGFAKDPHPTRGDSLGLTCAACHTGQFRYNGVEVRIDGGQSLGDLEQLQNAILGSLSATLADSAKMTRFSDEILGSTATAEARDALRAEMVNVHAWWEKRIARSKGLSPHGPSRTDAFTIIGNEVVCALFQDQRNCMPGVAPTQFPHLWGTPDFEWVQYNSSVHSPIGRNVGQVTGVFAEANFDPTIPQLPLVSTANFPNLHKLEETLKSLKAPKWDEQVLPAIDRTLAARGETLYAANCASCHPLVAPRSAPNQFGVDFAQMNFSTPTFDPTTGQPVGVGTDRTAAATFATRRAYPGPFTQIAAANGLIGPDGKASVAALLSISGSLITQRFFALNGLNDFQKLEYLGFRESRTPSNAQLITYKARPLDGIAFTAPYLHNGSVPTMYDLLLPPSQRPTQFWVGSRDFDPVKLGYSTAQTDGSVLLNTAQLGNGNGGHYYGTDLADADRYALIEYIKTL